MVQLNTSRLASVNLHLGWGRGVSLDGAKEPSRSGPYHSIFLIIFRNSSF